MQWWQKFFAGKHEVVIVLALFLLPLMGTVGYALIEGWHWFDALYMTIITITTIGYEEVHPLSPAGRVFTVVFVLFGVSIALYVLNVLAQTFLQPDRFFQQLAVRKAMKLRDHYIICGAGRAGTQIAVELHRLGKSYVLIEQSEEVVRELRQAGTLVIAGDATEEAILKKAQIQHARGLVTVLPHDADNVFVVLTARGLNPTLHIVARAETAGAEVRLKRAGADAVVSPYQIGAVRLAYLLLRKSLIDTFELVTKKITLDVHVQEISITGDHPFEGKTLRELDLTNQYRVIALAVKWSDDRLDFPPNAQLPLQSGTTVIVAGPEEHLRKLEQYCQQSMQEPINDG